MTLNVNDLIITSLETATAFSRKTGALLWILDEMSQATISNTEDKEKLTGRNGRTLGSLKKNKAATVKGTSGVVSTGMMATQVGYGAQSGDFNVNVPDELTVSTVTESDTTTSTATLTYAPVGGKVKSIAVLQENGQLGQVYSGTDYTVSDKTVTFASTVTIANGTKVVAYYDRQISGDKVTNFSDKYSEIVDLYIDAFAEDKCTNTEYHIQFHFPKADFSGTFDIDLNGSQVSHAFEAEALAGNACRVGSGRELWTYIVYGEQLDDTTNTTEESTDTTGDQTSP